MSESTEQRQSELEYSGFLKSTATFVNGETKITSPENPDTTSLVKR